MSQVTSIDPAIVGSLTTLTTRGREQPRSESPITTP
jgi:hypothetical protein